jgi:hypothetical protein
MALFDLNPQQIPGEAAVVALASLFEELAKDQTPEQKQQITQRFLDLTAPYHAVAVAINQHLAQFLAKVLHIDITQPVETPPASVTPIKQ